MTVDQLEKKLNKIKYFGFSFNNKMAVIPLTLFAFTFASYLSHFVEFHKMARLQTTFIRILSACEMLLKLSSVLAMATVSSYINKCLEPVYEASYGLILKTEGLSDKAHYVKERQEDYRIKLSALGFFDLNPKCILTYLSSLVTFTILFMQLNKVL
ncbi:hypothetical protein HDE_00198 [Halotydeus destructor]|nr:hypothetical protein HDE_00198 [Halotydeus destructor]